MLKFKTDGQELFYLDGGDVIVGDTIRYLEAEFDLSDDWKSFPEVTAYFKCGAAINSIILAGGKIKAEDNLALAPGVWSVYLRAYELEGEEIKRQITSSTAKINVLSHGKFTGREFVPENADAYEKRMTEMRNYLVFEEYNPSKKYVKGNKVSYEGSSYVLTADSATGTNPTDGESWLLIAERGKDGTRIFEFPFKGYNPEVGKTYQFGSLQGFEEYYEQTIPGIDSWREGDYFLSEDGKMLIIEGMIKEYGVVRFITVRCLADIKGKDGKDGEKGTTIHTVENFGLGKTTPVGMYFVNDREGARPGVIYKNFTMPEGFVSGDLLFDGANGLMFDHDYQEYSYTKDDVTYYETYDAIWCIANLNGTVPEGKYANIDLSNVSDEDFKAKAESAGVGGDAGLADEKNFMVFKGVVSELPKTANEGEVYKLNQDYSGGDKWILISSGENDIDADGTVSDYEITMYNYNSTGSVIYHSIADVIDNKTGDSVKIWIHVYREATGASGDVYFDATRHYGNYSEGPGMYYASITGKKDNATTTDNIGNWDWTHYEAYYFGEEIYPAGTYARHNGEWVDISKDGVTKAEMESYIEETLLGGEW